MSFRLKRVSDGAGDVGSLSQAIKWNEDDTFKEVVNYFPTIGCSMLVGSMTARSYSNSDYWITTPVVEILEEIKNDDTFYIRFKTKNNEYEWWNGMHPNEVI